MKQFIAEAKDEDTDRARVSKALGKDTFSPREATKPRARRVRALMRHVVCDPEKPQDHV